MRNSGLLPRAAGLGLLALLALGGCVSNSGGGSTGDVAVTASPKRYELDPLDKPKQVCESTMEGNQPKTICY